MDPRTRASLLLLLLCGAVIGLVRGGVPVNAQAACALLVALALWLSRRGTAPQRASPWVLMPLVLAGVALVQCVPLPPRLLALVAPENFALRTLPPVSPATLTAWMPLSLDVPQTLQSLAFSLTLAMAALTAARLAQEPRTQRVLSLAPLWAALLQLAWALGALLVTGVFRAGFVNRNHLAALLVSGALTALAAAQEAKGRQARVLLWCAASVCVAAVLLTLSRGAVIGLGAGVLVLAVTHTRSSRSALGLVLLGALALAVVSAGQPLAGRWLDLGPARLTQTLRLRAFAGALEAARSHWLLGAGRGAYRFVSDLHTTTPADVTFVYAENEPLQLVTELGLPGALVIFALIALGVRDLWRARRQPVVAGALAVFAALAVHNLADFNLELLGVALPLWTALGAAARVEARSDAARSERTSGGRSLLGKVKLARVLVYAGALAALASHLGEAHSADLAARTLQALGSAPNDPLEPLLAAAQSEVALHPADTLVSLSVASALHARTPPHTRLALGWAGRAEALSPGTWRPHFVAGAILLRAGARSQARIEVKLAFERVREAAQQELIDLALEAAAGVDELDEVAPADLRVRLRLVSRLAEQRRFEEAAALAQRSLAQGAAQDPREEGAALDPLRVQLAWALLQSNQSAQAAQVIPDIGTLPCAKALLQARLAHEQGQPAAVSEQLLMAAAPQCPRDYELTYALVSSLLTRGAAQEALKLLADARFAPEGTAWEVEGRLLRADAFEAAGQAPRADAERATAAALSPEDALLASRIADQLVARGDRAGALDFLRRAEARAHGTARARVAEKLNLLQRR
ncbi:MAG: O-antigen ligase family protein [Deltaproteobacteria bacterium]|nr:O-antigen ligase family protein [Deltaproteobacteria bacterium]